MDGVKILEIKMIGAGIVFIAFALIVIVGYALGVNNMVKGCCELYLLISFQKTSLPMFDKAVLAEFRMVIKDELFSDSSPRLNHIVYQCRMVHPCGMQIP